MASLVVRLNLQHVDRGGVCARQEFAHLGKPRSAKSSPTWSSLRQIPCTIMDLQAVRIRSAASRAGTRPACRSRHLLGGARDPLVLSLEAALIAAKPLLTWRD